MNRIPELTGLRCLAVVMVVLGHALKTVPVSYSAALTPLRLFSDGALGVRIFFVLSGFLITGMLRHEHELTGQIRIGRFYQRRILRIWPASYAYILTVTLFVALGHLQVDWKQLTAAAAHLWNYGAALGLDRPNPARPDGGWFLSHFWTLALEEQFYWFWPPLLLVFLKKNSNGLLLLIILIPILRVASYFLVPRLRPQLGMMLHTGVDPILVGAYVALEQERLRRWLDAAPSTTGGVTLAALLVWLASAFWAGTLRRYWSATFGSTIEAAIIGALILLLAYRSDFWLARFLRTKITVFIGTISFSLYLWQQLFLGAESPIATPFPLNIVLAIGAATLSYYLIESPFLRLKDQLTKETDSQAATTIARAP